ncbi:hypothetical protein AG4045_000129 [Apium graveolens]|uniref:Uncharacterized protein n=1 Tax=Apium graveolens TaxID=4045 RepID=A0A6L5BB53_APIGR|nr:hypothetical protein AG4045_000129 [Apium graveolens]
MNYDYGFGHWPSAPLRYSRLGTLRPETRTADDNDRYGNETVHSEHQILDWADRLYLTTNLADQRKFQFWPQNPENFK